jgi:gluconolactonase
MRRPHILLAFGVLVLTGEQLLTASGQTAGAVSTRSSTPQKEIAGVLAAGATLELVKDGFGNLDGPVAAPDGSLYFSDAGFGQTLRLRSDGTIDVVRDQTNGDTSLAFDGKGRLIVLESIPARVVAIDDKQNVTVLAESPRGGARYFLNDLTVDQRGGIYFTDPPPRSQGGDTRDPRVVYITPEGGSVAIPVPAKRPTGIILTADGRTLLIADADSTTVFGLDVQADGTATNPRRWLKLKNIPAGQTGAAEALAIDAENRLFVATSQGVQVYSPTGELLGTIVVPRPPSNLAFAGPDRKTLYITARSDLYRIRTISAGPAGRAK